MHARGLPRDDAAHAGGGGQKRRSGPILVMSTQPAVPGGVLRPIVEPIPLFPWTMIWRADNDHPGLRALHAAVDELTPDWTAVSEDPRETWLPQPESSRA